jgi:serine/threonine-protein kinase
MIVGYDGRLRVIDFGICKSGCHRQVTSPGVQKGKFAYMSPEQLYGQPIDRRADVFALGTVLWEAVTGRRLFKGDDIASTIKRVLELEVPAPSTLVPGLLPVIDALTERALAREKDRRFSTTEEMAHAAVAALEMIGGTTHAIVERFIYDLFPERPEPETDPMLEVTERVESPLLAAV